MARENITRWSQVLDRGIRGDMDEILGIQSRILTRSGLQIGDGLSRYVDEEHVHEQAVRNYVNLTSSYLVKLKTHLNTFASINRLPAEILAHIILFAYLPRDKIRHPYILYTWICRHWRSTLIQDPTLWSLIRFESEGDQKNPWILEFIQRSKLAPLDIVITPKFHKFIPTLEDSFASMSDRISRLSIPDCYDDVTPLFAGKTFPSLRRFECTGGYNGCPAMLSALVASERLDALHCTLTEGLSPDFMDQLATVFSRIRNLFIQIYEPAVMQPTFDLLHNSVNLQSLCFISDQPTDPNNPIILPELKFLWTEDLSLTENLQTPNLSSFDAHCTLANHSTIEQFDFSSIRYLYITDSVGVGLSQSTPSSIVGSKEPIGPQSVFSTNFTDAIKCIDPVQDTFKLEDFLSDAYPRDCFRLQYSSKDILVEALLSILPRMTSLTELYLLIDPVMQGGVLFKQVAIRVPSVEKVVVKYDRKLIDYIQPLKDASFCPRLTHLSYVAPQFYYPFPYQYEDTASLVGKSLTECLKSRQKPRPKSRKTSRRKNIDIGNKLEHISLEKCPPLPDIWLKGIQKLGTTVVTAR